MGLNENEHNAHVVLKEYNSLVTKIKILGIEIEFLENSNVDSMDMELKSIGDKCEKVSGVSIKNYFNVAGERLTNLKTVCQFLQMRKGIIDAAVEGLEQEDELSAKVIKGIYIDNMTWKTLGIRLYMSNNTLNRRRKAGLKYIGDNLAPTRTFY